MVSSIKYVFDVNFNPYLYNSGNYLVYIAEAAFLFPLLKVNHKSPSLKLRILMINDISFNGIFLNI